MVEGCDGVGADRDERMQSLVSQLPLQHASMLTPVRYPDASPITTLASMARESATRLGPPAGGLVAANTPNPSGAAIPASAARRSGIGCGMSAGLGQAQLVVDVAADAAGVDTHFDGFFSDVRWVPLTQRAGRRRPGPPVVVCR